MFVKSASVAPPELPTNEPPTSFLSAQLDGVIRFGTMLLRFQLHTDANRVVQVVSRAPDQATPEVNRRLIGFDEDA